MKKTALLLLVLATFVGFYSCKKDETRVVLDTSKITAPALNVAGDGSQVDINPNNLDSSLLFTWTAANYGFSTAINYFLQMDVAGNHFKKPSTLGSTHSELSFTLGYNELNNKLLLMESDPENPIPLHLAFRVIALVSSAVDTVASNTDTLSMTPYYITIVYPQLYVPGAYQNWKPDLADSIGSLKSDGNYEGYIYMNVGGEFKFTSARDWNHTNYGNSGTPGVLTTDNGAGNISVPDSGIYKFNVNTNALTWEYLETSWAVVGDATPGGWNTDTPLNYDPDTQLLTITMDLTAGDIKFRANGSDDLNYGSNDQNGRLQEGGGNIHVSEAGNYTITLDLSHTIYKYKVLKN